MTLDKFVSKWNGKSPTHPKGIPGQCVCLYRCYLDEVLEVPQSPSVSGARLIWNTFNPKYFDRIPRSAFQYPKKGDIVIFSAFPGNVYGHVGMCLASGVVGFTSFDANWSVMKRARIEQHTFRYVIGWLRKKPEGISDEAIQELFRSIWKREPATGDWMYFKKRLQNGTITGSDDLYNKVSYWYSVVYPNGKYSFTGDAKWQLEKIKY